MTVASPMLRGDTPSAPNTGGKNSKVRKPRKPRKEACQHHYIIEEPHGATSRGVCKRCGRRRRFHNYYHPNSARERFKR